ncbi:MAG: valine--tRNA ligase [Candidatus Shapirobacteria bacterium]|jgi:valyl-tRNA synthetase
MDKAYTPSSEPDIYKLWESADVFTAKIGKLSKAKSASGGKPYSIILPLPNANDPMHMGHALFTIQDILCRYHRLLGDSVLWLPGSDHAGIETQFVFEKKLQKEGKSRFDFDRETLYRMIWDFVETNREINIKQMKQLGFSMDWTRYHYSLEPAIVKNILAVFKKLHHDGLVYRAEKIVNYCTHCGTAFSNLEVDYVDEVTSLYYMKYGPFTLATTRPETKFGDTAVAVNPKDTRYQQYIGQEITVDGLIGPFKVKVIADDMVDMQFGTGVVKITPAHDPDDFEAGLRHHLAIKRVIGFDGRLNELTGKYAGLTVSQARQKVVEDMKASGMLIKVDDQYQHRIGRCYKCKHVIEPMVMPQWFVKIDSLAKPALAAAQKGQVKFFPLRFKKQFTDWMQNIRDWNISRQIVWGPRLPAWYCLECHPGIKLNFITPDKTVVTGLYSDLKANYSYEVIKSGLQSLSAPVDTTYYVDEPSSCPKCGSSHLLQETDTFDTWFLSGQWPLNTLGFNPADPSQSSPDFAYFYPTSVLDTLWDILFFWVARMIMFGLYLAGDVPFKTVHIHARVVDKAGQKMSKSKGNVIDPVSMTQTYGTDALRFALVYGVAPAADIAISEDKIRAHRNFVNKIWNASRFILMKLDQLQSSNPDLKINFNLPLFKGRNGEAERDLNPADLAILQKLDALIVSTTKHLNSYHFGQASEGLYQFFWHEFCDIYIESVKSRGEDALPILFYVLITCLKLLHPFIPFVTESVYQQLVARLGLSEKMLAVSSWPTPHDSKSSVK